jgi:ketosteroid isomerase-like protein
MDHERFLLRFFEAWNRHDVDALADLYAEEAVMVDPTLGAHLAGREAIRGYYRDMFAASPEARHLLLDSAAVDSRVFMEWRFRPREGNEAFGVSIFTLEGERIVRDVAYWNPAALEHRQ